MSNPIALYMRVSELLGRTYVPVVIDPRGGLTAGLDYNGNAPIDASTQINAFLAQASEKLPVILDFDIGVGMLEPVYIPNGYASIIGRGHATGVFMMPGANCHCISNQLGWQGNGFYPNQTPNTTAPAQSTISILIKDLFINGNRGTGAAVATPTMTTVNGSSNITVSSATSIAKGQLIQGTGIPALTFVGSISGTTIGMVDKTGAAANATASGSGVSASFFASNWTTGNPAGIRTVSGGFNQLTWGSGVNLVSCQDVTVDGVYFYSIPSFNCGIGNVTNYTVRNCTFDGSAVQTINTDGVHIYGPAIYGHIEGNTFIDIYDDGVALNAPEGYGGNIQYFTVANNTYDHCLTFFRCYSHLGGTNPQYHVTDGAISNLAGTLYTTFAVTPVAISLSLDAGAVTGILSNAIDRISVSNVTALGTAHGSGGNIGQYFARLSDSIGSVSFSNCRLSPYGQGWFFFNDTNTPGLKIASIKTEGCAIYRNVGLGSPSGGIGASETCTIDVLEWDVQCEDADGTAFTNLDYVIDPTNLTVTRLIIRHLDPTHWAALINGSTWTNLPSISGTGVMESLFQIPDAQMANGVLYLSGTTFAGDAALKIGGTAYKVAGP